MANGVTIRFIGDEQAVQNAWNLSTPKPLFLLEDPRNTGTPEWFAVVYYNTANPKIGEYAKSTGSAVSTFFTPPGGTDPVPFNNIVTSLVTVMNGLFKDAITFNKSVRSWDTSGVNSMDYMFAGANAFNQDVSSFDTSNVQNMEGMFSMGGSNPLFNNAGFPGIGSWNTSKVATMKVMFFNAKSFSQNLNGWNVANVTNRAEFAAGSALEADVTLQPIWLVLKYTPITTTTVTTTINGNGDTTTTTVTTGGTIKYTDGLTLTSEPLFVYKNPRGTGSEWFAVVTNSSRAQIKAYANSAGSEVSAYFTKSGQPGPVPFNNIVTTLMTNMSSIFGSTTFNKNISSWDTSNVTTMSSMFLSATLFNNGGSNGENTTIGSWNTSNVQNMRYMFYEADAFNQNIGSWNTGNVEDMSSMFARNGNSGQNIIIGSWNTSKVKYMNNMFEFSNFNQYIGSWNTSIVQNMSYMFYHAPKFLQNLSGWNVTLTIDRPTLNYTSFAQNSLMSQQFQPQFQ